MGLPPLAFPPRNQRPSLTAAEVGFRQAGDGDAAFLRELYRSLRMDELRVLPWSAHDKHAFLDQQASLQHRHYLTAFPDAAFLVVEQADAPIGRLYFDATGDPWRLLDIALLPEVRNRGIGASILRALQAHARAAGARGIVLHVEHGNIDARRLYHRLSFRETDSGPTHRRMEWSCVAAPADEPPEA